MYIYRRVEKTSDLQEMYKEKKSTHGNPYIETQSPLHQINIPQPSFNSLILEPWKLEHFIGKSP